MKFDLLYNFYLDIINEGTEQENILTRFIASCKPIIDLLNKYNNVTFKRLYTNVNIYQYKDNTKIQQHCVVDLCITKHSMIRYIIRNNLSDVISYYNTNEIIYKNNMNNKDLSKEIVKEPPSLFSNYNINDSYNNIINSIDNNTEKISKIFNEVITNMINKNNGIHLNIDENYKILLNDATVGISTHYKGIINENNKKLNRYLFNITTMHFNNFKPKGSDYYIIEMKNLQLQ